MSANTIILYDPVLVLSDRIWVAVARTLAESDFGLWFSSSAGDWTKIKDWVSVAEGAVPQRSAFLIDSPSSTNARVLLNTSIHVPDPEPRFESAPWGLRWPKGVAEVVRRMTGTVELQPLYPSMEPLDFFHKLVDAVVANVDGYQFDESTSSLTSYDGGEWTCE